MRLAPVEVVEVRQQPRPLRCEQLRDAREDVRGDQVSDLEPLEPVGRLEFGVDMNAAEHLELAHPIAGSAEARAPIRVTGVWIGRWGRPHTLS